MTNATTLCSVQDVRTVTAIISEGSVAHDIRRKGGIKHVSLNGLTPYNTAIRRKGNIKHASLNGLTPYKITIRRKA